MSENQAFQKRQDILAYIGQISVDWQYAPNISTMRHKMNEWHSAYDMLKAWDDSHD